MADDEYEDPQDFDYDDEYEDEDLPDEGYEDEGWSEPLPDDWIDDYDSGDYDVYEIDVSDSYGPGES